MARERLTTAADSRSHPLIAVVGPTATGKTRLGVALAQAFGGEIVGADSRQMYEGMAIGTAQPSAAELSAAPHHLIGVLAPDSPFGLATYLDYARAAIAEIRSRDRLPIVVGGTGQYVWALLEAWTVPRVPPDSALRRELEAFSVTMGAERLHERLEAVDPVAAAAIHVNNVRRVIRALEVFERTGFPISTQQRRTQPVDSLLIGLTLPRAALYARIDRRVEEMYAGGLLDEVRRLELAGFGRHLPSMASIGYPEAWKLLAGEVTLENAILLTQQATHRLARQQHGWFRAADSRIHWLDAADPLVEERTIDLAACWLAGAAPEG
ncbi:MAG: tRNA (adenosine(37)-N6)-dimethylallyltransferase MiaA [Dehalococcoidia bacterium]